MKIREIIKSYGIKLKRYTNSKIWYSFSETKLNTLLRFRSQKNEKNKFLLICERDVGMFSLYGQVLSNISLVLSENKIPIVCFGENCCYWTPDGYAGKQSVWEYYFEPLFSKYDYHSLPENIKNKLQIILSERGYVNKEAIESNYDANTHYGDRPKNIGKVLLMPYLRDPSKRRRRMLNRIVRKYIKPRDFILEKVKVYWEKNMQNHYVIGVHIRGTDALSDPRRIGMLNYDRYIIAIKQLLKYHQKAKILITTDDERSLEVMQEAFKDKIICYDAIRYVSGISVGKGPTGSVIPSYIANDRSKAAQNGEEAVIEFLLLSKCDFLIFNGSGLARTTLVVSPELPYLNINNKRYVLRLYAMKLKLAVKVIGY